MSLRADATRVVVDADGRHIGIPWDPKQRISGERFVREEPRPSPRPGNLVTWAVDRARAASWFGDERMQWTKAVAYAAFDRLDTAPSGRFGPSARSDPVGEGLGEAPERCRGSHQDPETTGGLRRRSTSLVNPPLADEGKMVSSSTTTHS